MASEVEKKKAGNYWLPAIICTPVIKCAPKNSLVKKV